VDETAVSIRVRSQGTGGDLNVRGGGIRDVVVVDEWDVRRSSGQCIL